MPTTQQKTSAASTWILLFERLIVDATIIANCFAGLGQEFGRELGVPCCWTGAVFGQSTPTQASPFEEVEIRKAARSEAAGSAVGRCHST